MPVYDYTIHNRSDKTILVEPAPVIVLEGILIFAEPSLCELMDIRVFVDTDADVRILRRIVRDVKDRGRSLDSVINQYLTTVKPMQSSLWSRANGVQTSLSRKAGKMQLRWRC